MSGPTASLTFAGDSDTLARAAKRAQQSVADVSGSVSKSSADMQQGAKDSQEYTTRLAKIGAIATGASTAIQDAGDSVQALVDFQNRGREKAMAHARALAAVEQASLDAAQAEGDLRQAQEDLNQSMMDARQGTVDAAQAQLDIKKAAYDASEAQTAYNQAVKEHGRNSAEAQKAMIDLEQAQVDMNQAQVDAEQAQRDIAQAQLDGQQATRDSAQATRDAKDAQLDLVEAQRAAKPTSMASAASELQAYAGVAQSLIGTIGLLSMAYQALALEQIKGAAMAVGSRIAMLASAAATGVATAATWAWNAAMAVATSPITLTVLAIGALVAAVVWIATQTTWFQTIWHGMVTGVKAAAGALVDGVKWYMDKFVAVWSAVWSTIKNVATTSVGFITSIPGKIGSVFATVANAISAPFRAAFNLVARAWNATVGSLRWTVPGWVPGVGGNTISAPHLPTFHQGGRVPGLPGQEVLSILQAGETVIPAGAAQTIRLVLESSGSRIDDILMEMIIRAIRAAGGIDVIGVPA